MSAPSLSPIWFPPGRHVDDIDEAGLTRLAGAVLTQNPILVARLLASNANPDIQGPRGMTALMYAAQHGEQKCFDLLLAAGANPNLEDRSFRTALNLVVASGKGTVGMIGPLVALGTDPDHTDMRGWTPLADALILNRLEIARELLLVGANPNAPTDSGTPMKEFLAERGVSGDVIDWIQTAADAKELSSAIKNAPTNPRSPSL